MRTPPLFRSSDSTIVRTKNSQLCERTAGETVFRESQVSVREMKATFREEVEDTEVLSVNHFSI